MMSKTIVRLRLNQQQLELIDKTIAAGESNSRDDLVRRALREFAARASCRRRRRRRWQAMSGRTVLKELIIEPGTGKALELRRGQILRIEQIAGRQCADFNCFNLHDYKEFFHTGRTRHLHGLHPTKGDFLWSAPPRERPMMAIIEDTAGTNDVLYPRCSAFLFEYHYGLRGAHQLPRHSGRGAARIRPDPRRRA